MNAGPIPPNPQSRCAALPLWISTRSIRRPLLPMFAPRSVPHQTCSRVATHLYVRLRTFLSSRAGALQFTEPPTHLDESPSRFVDSNASIEANTNIEEKYKVRTISASIQEPIILTFLLFSDVLLFKCPQAKTPAPNAEKTTREQLRLPVRRRECKNSSEMIKITYSKMSTIN